MSWNYIRNSELNIYYVPRAPSLCEARDREAAFKKAFGEDIKVFIVGPFEWDIIESRGDVETLEV